MGSLPASACKAGPEAGPLIRITPMPAGGGPLDRAKIVSNSALLVILGQGRAAGGTAFRNRLLKL